MAEDLIGELTLKLELLASTQGLTVCREASKVILTYDEALTKAERERSILLEALQ